MAGKKHYFVLNKTAGSVDRRGPFATETDARAWAEKHYKGLGGCWLLPAEPINDEARNLIGLDRNGNPSEG